MSAIFVSHSSRDNVTADEIAAWLRSERHESFFLDFDPELGIPAGRSWEKELYSKLRSCRAVIVLCSRHSMASRWCFAEVAQARALGKVLLPVRIDDCTVDGLLASQQVTDLTADKETGFERLRRGLLAAGVDPSDVFEWDGRRPPYPGLLAFAEQDVALFFGRRDEIGAGLDLLNRVRRLGSAANVIVVGPSGSGKSSLVRAGLVPRLRKDDERWLVVDPFRPGRDPVTELAAVWSRMFTDTGTSRDLGAIADEIGRFVAARGDDNPLVAMATELRRTARQSEARVLLVVDQFEELLDPTSSDAAAVLTLLRNATDAPDSPLLVLATLRSDFTGAFQQHPVLRGSRSEFMSLGPMSTDEVAKVIVEPAAVVGLELEAGLVQAMMPDVEVDDSLPLLAFTLRELFDRYSDDWRIDVSEYRDLGGLHGALAQVADELIEAQELSDDQQEQLRRAFLRMVRLTDDDRWVRRVARWDEHPESIHPVLQQFVTARLLVSGGGADGATLEVAHEAIFGSWGRLANWLRDDAYALRLRRDLDYSAKGWIASEKDDADLWRGDRLDRAEKLVEREDVALGADDREFIGASRRAAQAEADRLERTRRRRLQIASLVTIGALVLLGVAGWTFRQARHEADRASNEALRSDALTLAAEALGEVPENPALALSLAAEAHEMTTPAQPRAEAALFEARRAFGARRGQQIGEPLRGHADAVRQVAFSPDGSMLVSASNDTTVRRWDTATGDLPPDPLRGHGAAVYGVAFSPVEPLIASASLDGTVRLWDSRTGEQMLELPGHDGGAWGVAFSPDGTMLASSDDKGTIRLWDPRDGHLILDFSGHDRRVRFLAFSRDGELLATASDDGTIGLWDPATGEAKRAPLEGHDGPVFGLAFGPERLLASAGADGVRLWEADTGEELGPPLGGHEGWVLAVAFNEDGSLLASGGADRTVRLWDPKTRTPVGEPLRGHQDWVGSVAFGGPRQLLASGGADNTIRLWDLTPGTAIGQRLAASSGIVRAIAFNPVANLMASAGADGYVRLWNSITGEATGEMGGDAGAIRAVAFSRDGALLASAGDDGRIRLWNPATLEPVGNPLGERGAIVFDVAFSPSEDLLASAGGDGVVRLWNPITREAIGDLHAADDVDGHHDRVLSVSFSRDGALLASAGDDGKIRLWDPDTIEQVGEPFGGFDGAIRVAFSPSEDLLASAGSNGVVRLWNPITRTASGDPLTGHANVIFDVAFSRTGALLATGGEDRTVRLWGVSTRRQIGFPLTDHNALVYTVAFSPQRSLLASGDATGAVLRWDVWDVAVACDLAAPYVTEAQLSAHLPPGTEPKACGFG